MSYLDEAIEHLRHPYDDNPFPEDIEVSEDVMVHYAIMSNAIAAFAEACQRDEDLGGCAAVGVPAAVLDYIAVAHAADHQEEAISEAAEDGIEEIEEFLNRE